MAGAAAGSKDGALDEAEVRVSAEEERSCEGGKLCREEMEPDHLGKAQARDVVCVAVNKSQRKATGSSDWLVNTVGDIDDCVGFDCFPGVGQKVEVFPGKRRQNRR